MKFSDSEWNLVTANGIQCQRIEFSASELKFSDSELSLATESQILANIETNGQPLVNWMEKIDFD